VSYTIPAVGIAACLARAWCISRGTYEVTFGVVPPAGIRIPCRQHAYVAVPPLRPNWMRLSSPCDRLPRNGCLARCDPHALAEVRKHR